MIKDTELNEKQRAEAFDYICQNGEAKTLFDHFFELSKFQRERLLELEVELNRIRQELDTSRADRQDSSTPTT